MRPSLRQTSYNNSKMENLTILGLFILYVTTLGYSIMLEGHPLSYEWDNS